MTVALYAALATSGPPRDPVGIPNAGHVNRLEAERNRIALEEATRRDRARNVPSMPR